MAGDTNTDSSGLIERYYELGRRLGENAEERDRRGAKDTADWRPLWQAAADAGVLGLVLPKAYGGAGLPVLDAVRALASLGRGCRDNGILLGLNGQLWAMQMSIYEFGTEAQKAQWLPDMVSGAKICAHGVTETASGSNAMTMQTRAERVPDGYRLSGEKVWIGMAPSADMVQVFASTRPEHGAWGLSVFLVDLDHPGITRSAPYDKVGHRSVPAGELRFDDVEVPESARLGPEGAGQAVFNRSIDWERRFIFSGHLGAMKRQLDETAQFARDRKPGGTAIEAHQSVSNRLADMRLRYETSRLMIENAASEIDRKSEDKATAALVKLHVAESLLSNAEDALRIRGGAGYRIGETERMLRDAVGCVTLGGTSDIQRRIIASLLRPSGAAR